MAFYKLLQEQVTSPLINLFNDMITSGTLSDRLNEAKVIVLLKPSRDEREVGSYRPISLLNCNIKIYAKILANRLARVLPDLVASPQVGFVKGRSVASNIRALLASLETVEAQKRPSVLVSFDAEKAFDRVVWNFMFEVLKKVGIEGAFRNAVGALYSNPQAYMWINGEKSDLFPIRRGTRQGCPLSPLLFVLVLDPLIREISAHPEVTGVKWGPLSFKVSAFADDILVHLTQPKRSLEALLELFQEYGDFSGFKINYSKSLALTTNDSVRRLWGGTFPLKWAVESLRYLGVRITMHTTALYQTNITRLVDTMKGQLGSCLINLVSGYTYRNCIRYYNFSSTVSCRNVTDDGLHEALADLPNNIHILILSRNNIQHLPVGSFVRLNYLVHLQMDCNWISSIKAGAFQDLGSLSILNLSSNVLKSLQPDVFRGLANLSTLILSHNFLASFSADVMRPLVQLQLLDFSSNNLTNFSSVVEAVAGLHTLNTLNIKQNHIHCLTASTLLPHGLSYLSLANNSISQLQLPLEFLSMVQKLDMSNTSLQDTQNLTSLNLSSLLYLDMKGNPMSFKEVENLLRYLKAPVQNLSLSFMNMSQPEYFKKLCQLLQGKSVRYLMVKRNNFQNVTGSMDSCGIVEHLDLSYNNIKVPNLFSNAHLSKTLKRLDLVHNKIHTIKFCKGKQFSNCLPNLWYLSLQYNRLSAVPSNAFYSLTSLTHLSLAVNEINYISKTAFQGLTKLQYLTLSNNAIGEVFDTTFSYIHALKILKLRNNRIAVLYNSTFSSLWVLEVLDLGKNNIKRIEEATFKGLKFLQDLYLDQNQLESISSTLFQDLKALQVLDLANNRLKFTTGDLSDPPFVYLGNLRVLKLQKQQMHGLKMLPQNLFSKLHALKQLIISDNFFHTLGNSPFQELKNLTELDMRDTSIANHAFYNQTFTGLSNLKILHLENVGLGALEKGLFQELKNLSILILKNNFIHSVEEGDIPDLPRLQYLDLSFNSMLCTCTNAWFQDWARSSPVQVVFFQQYRCLPPSQRATYLVDFDKSICDIDLGLLAFCCSVPVVLTCLFVSIGHVKGKWYFVYGFYVLRIWLQEVWLRRRKEKPHRPAHWTFDLLCRPSNFHQLHNCFFSRYDAFVSYSIKDEDWVLTHLLPNLEEKEPPQFKLCLHQRDFEVGKPIVSNIVDAIYNSRKTLCIVSRNYLVSDWCSMEVQVALYRLFDEHHDVLVLIFLDEIPDCELSDYTRVRKIMKKKTYLKWPKEPEAQMLFWAKLREALKHITTDSEKRRSPLLAEA
ncbi:toll-like receptor 13 [Microcaecilia unicolor]|uniref:Toll-like receptor 13 n=1 Tax=Microcaecilia unicolor TaxID=1415580 RepID=A0A6P7ZHD0_9AMPH|nr:toll-like receptor 13 [Microcaecilia unicolor]